MKSKNGFAILAVLAGLAVVSLGVSLITSGHNKIVASGDAGRVYVGVQRAIGPGVVEAVSNNKGEAAIAVIAGALTAYAVDKSAGKDKESGPATPTISITGNGNAVNTGSGQQHQDNSRSGE